jgi:hypothetical protein
MSPAEKEAFLKYEIAIIDPDLQQDDPKIIELFKRLNRTFYALSAIEKLSTEFGSSEFMLTAKLLAGELKEDPSSEDSIDPTRHEYDPNLSPEFVAWAGKQKVAAYGRLVLESTMFTKQEIARQVHLMFTLNIMATVLDGYYNRNENAIRYLDSRADIFNERQEIVKKIEDAATTFNKLRFPANSYWYGKSNAFTLLVTLFNLHQDLAQLEAPALRQKLLKFGENPPPDYALAAKEAVNNKRERLTRATYVTKIVRDNIQIPRTEET